LAAGNWELTINAPEGQIQGVLKLNQSGSGLSGEITTPFGTAPLKGGAITGNDVKFDFTINVQGQQIDVAATGKINGDAINGSFAAGGQSSTFTGTRKPN
jgi:hypothetical protein